MTKEKPLVTFFTNADRKRLLASLETYYITKLNQYNYNLKTYKSPNKTIAENYNRRFRLEVKAIELILYSLGSNFMKNVKPNSRKTSELNARSSGLIQGELKPVDN
ncbi:hypothetical protein [Mucilaginibacter sp. 5C4]|uniref:hypothetical protein n=1 Tax=Mucilaginibacter sp. 5C4 TaxID=3048589 RepID=UPI002AC8AE83|nr:hypothetical protein [Mucilaginibacter sp. 5C4]MEB0302357.1 hypothetical protein [Mucilaginibacter sp. 5C4]WPX22151.1 hypothetical protein RHM67_12750 [Mucilaginibacter sp. 5C4]